MRACCLDLSGSNVADNMSSPGGRSDISGPVYATSSYNVIGVDTGLSGISDGVGGNRNNAIAALGASGQLTVQCNMSASLGTTHVVLDAFGYFQ